MRFLFVDRLLQLSSSEASVRGLKHITSTDAYLCPDLKGRLCFMPAIIGETLGQLTAWSVMAQCDFRLRPVAGIVAEARVYRPAYVGETLALESWIDELDDTAVQYHGEVRVGNELVFSLEGALGPMLPMTDFIDPELVRRQFAEINRPGEWPLSLPTKALDIPLTPMSEGSAHRLCFDYITESNPGVGLTAIKKISRSAPYFPDHFPNKPVLPMTVLLECKLNLAQEFLARAGLTDTYSVRSLQRIKMNEFVYPGDEVSCRVTVKRQDAKELVLSYRSEVSGKRICVVDIVLSAEDSINDE